MLRYEGAKMAQAADYCAIALAAALPWSTSATSILAGLWLACLLPAMNWPDLRRTLITGEGGLPVVLVALGALGMLWAGVDWGERWGGFGSFLKLLTIPLLITQFSRSGRGWTLLAAFLLSCTVLLIASYIYLLFPSLPKGSQNIGVPVKSYIIQSAEFIICAFTLFFIAVAGRWMIVSLHRGLIVLLAFAFLFNLFIVATSRTSLVIIPLLGLLLGLRLFGWKGAMAALAGVLALIAIFYGSSSYLRERIVYTYDNLISANAGDFQNPTGERLVFWRKSIDFIAAAPVIGHGTGMIPEMFREAARKDANVVDAMVSTNPHNQTFAVGIQLGSVGIIIVWAMWFAHLACFRGEGIAAWAGLVIVVQNIVGSLFNSFLFDFTEGWLYVIGVGVIAGMVRRARAAGVP